MSEESSIEEAKKVIAEEKLKRAEACFKEVSAILEKYNCEIKTNMVLSPKE